VATRLVRGNAVHQNIDPAEHLHGRGDRRQDLALAGEIAATRPHTIAHVAKRDRQRIGFDVQSKDASTSRSERRDDGRSNATCRSSDQRYFSPQDWLRAGNSPDIEFRQDEQLLIGENFLRPTESGHIPGYAADGTRRCLRPTRSSRGRTSSAK
jgi:hypothetical protein